MHEWELTIKIKHISERDRGDLMRYIESHLSNNGYENDMEAIYIPLKKEKETFIKQLLNWWKK